MAATLEEIIVGTSLSDIEHFEEAKAGGITCDPFLEYPMFEDPMLAEIFQDMEKAYRDGTFNKDMGIFDVRVYIGNHPKLMRAIGVSIDGYFPSLKWEYNRECFYTGRGNWNDLKFTDYVKSFINNYVERCKAKRNRTS